MPIARNFVYHYKLLGVFSFADIFFLMTLLVFSAHWMLKRNSGRELFYFNVAPLIKIAVIQGTVIFSISLLGYLLHYVLGGESNVRNQFIYARGFIYFFALLLVLYRSVGDIKKIKFNSLLFLICIIDFINFLSGLVSTYIYTDYVWERYGVKVTIIDQDKIYNYFT
ncbi:hypothetical protein, partial [Serratia marcescens]